MGLDRLLDYLNTVIFIDLKQILFFNLLSFGEAHNEFVEGLLLY